MIIKVKILAKSSRVEIFKLSDKIYKVKLTKPREKGKANSQLIKVLADYFNVSKSRILIKQGQTSNRKIIEIKDI